MEDSIQISSVWIVDANGVTLVENWGHPPKSVGSYAHRDYFKAHLDGADILHIGVQDTGSITGRFTMSRRLRSADNRFQGVAVAGVFSDYFVSVYRDAGLGPDATLRLSLASGATLAQWPVQTAAAPAVRRITVETVLTRYPATITVTLPVSSALKEWRTRSLISGLFALSVIAAFAVLTAMGLRTAGKERLSRVELAKANAELERRIAERTAEARKVAADLAVSSQHLNAVYDTAPVGLCIFDRDMRFVRINERLAEINGVPVEQHIGRAVDEVVPTLAQAARAIFNRLIATKQTVLHREIAGETPAQSGVQRFWDESWAPILDEAGEVVGVNVAVVETTERKRAEERMAILAREVDHRAKNLLAVVQAVVRMTRADSVDEYVSLISGRIEALGRAHALLSASRWQSADLKSLVDEELAPYRSDKGRASVKGPPLALVPDAAQSVALVVHELATNAVKYGALSTPEGRVTAFCEIERGELTFRWTESGGPPVIPRERLGFGSKMIERSVSNQLTGKVSFT